MCSWCRPRPGILNDAQYAAAKAIFLQVVPLFFPDDRLTPVFVALSANVQTSLDEMKQELQEKFAPHYAHHDEEEIKEPERKVRAIEAPAPVPDLVPPPVLAPHAGIFDFDVGMDFKDEKKEEKTGIHWELRHWFDDANELKWEDPNSQPSVRWREDEKVFPRLALLARRFLCVLPTSAPSERVWSGFGHVISRNSSTIDSTIAAQIMYLRYNFHLTKQVPI
jgi:hypothetical protein